MEHQKSILRALLGNNLDRVTLIHNMRQFKVTFDDDAPFSILKYQLQLHIIEDISRDENLGENAYYSRLKKETEEYLVYHNQRLVKKKYTCCLSGCLFECSKHRDYIRHVRHSHSRDSNLTCHFGMECPRMFSSLDLLLQHLEEAHKKTTPPNRGQVSFNRREVPPIDTSCKCSMRQCGGPQFLNIRDLTLHLRNDHAEEVIECIFVDCDKRYNNQNSLKAHFREKHFKLGLCNLKSSNKTCQERTAIEAIPNVDPAGENTVYDEVLNENDIEGIDIETSSEEGGSDEEAEGKDEDLNEYFMMSYCDFLNRLTNVHFVPQSTVQIIGEEYLKKYNQSNESKVSVLKKSLQRVPNIAESEVNRVIEEYQKEDLFLSAQRKLDTEYKRVQFVKEKFSYVPPLEIVLNPKQVREKKAPKAVMHYISIIESIKNLVQDPSFIQVVENDEISRGEESRYKDVKDGELYKNNMYFKQNPEAFTLMLYSDAIELVNPLGAGRGKHKVIQIFFSLCEIPKNLRSKIDRIQLVAVFKGSCQI